MMQKIKTEQLSTDPLEGNLKPLKPGFGRGRMFGRLPAGSGSPGHVSVVVPQKRKIKKFSGETDRDYGLTEFIEEVEAAIPTLPPQEDPATFVFSHLEGRAKREVKTCGVSYQSVDDILAILKEAFGDKRPVSVVLRAFSERVQGKDENVREYASELFEKFRSLKDRQKELGQSVSEEALLCDHFVEGLKDKRLVWEMKREKSKVSFSVLRKTALEWEEIHDAPTPKHRTRADVSEIIDGHGSASCDVVGQVNPQTGATQSGSTVPSADGQRRQQRGFNSRGFHFEWTNDGKPICACCKGIGHMKRVCPNAVAGPKTQDLNPNPSL